MVVTVSGRNSQPVLQHVEVGRGPGHEHVQTQYLIILVKTALGLELQ